MLDYCIVAFFIVIVISVVQWFVDGRKNYKGPQIEIVGEDATGDAYQNGHANKISDESIAEADGNETGRLNGQADGADLKA